MMMTAAADPAISNSWLFEPLSAAARAADESPPPASSGWRGRGGGVAGGIAGPRCPKPNGGPRGGLKREGGGGALGGSGGGEGARMITSVVSGMAGVAVTAMPMKSPVDELATTALEIATMAVSDDS